MNTAREMKWKQRLEEERGSKSETGASSGPVSLKSSQIASGILSSTHPSLGCSNLARQEKLQVTKLQASTTEELIITSIRLFDSWDVFKLRLLFQEKEWEEKSVGTETSFTKSFQKGKRSARFWSSCPFLLSKTSRYFFNSLKPHVRRSRSQAVLRWRSNLLHLRTLDVWYCVYLRLQTDT